MTKWSRSLTVADYVAGLTAIAPRVTAVQRRLLAVQYHAPGRQVTAPQLAQLAEVEGGYSVVNAHYGRLGRMFCDNTGERPDVRQSSPNRGKERLWATWSEGWSGPDGFVWQMLPQVAEALEQLGWVYDETITLPAPATFTPPTANQYAAALGATTGLTDRHYQLLRIHYQAPERTTTAKRLAELMGYRRYSVANAQYGRLARLIGEQLDYNPDPQRLGTLVTFDKRQGEWHWIMRPEVAQALELLGWVEGFGVLLPEEIAAAAEPMVEGTRCRVLVSAYERDPEARRQCITAHGTTCSVCEFSFGAVYGEVAEGFIHVHHLRPLSEVGGAHQVDPVKDLRPVCPNCHAVLHHRVPAYSIQDVRGFLAQRNHPAPSAKHGE